VNADYLKGILGDGVFRRVNSEGIGMQLAADNIVSLLRPGIQRKLTFSCHTARLPRPERNSLITAECERHTG
jgi:hypothetical protein